MPPRKYTKFNFLGVLFVVLAGAAAVSLVYYWQMAHQEVPESLVHVISGTDQKDYENTEYGFQFGYNKDYQLDTSGSQANFFKNAAKSLASASVPQSLYPKTNFGSANLGVAVQPQSVESSCVAAAKTAEVNGTTFHVSEQDGAAAGTRYQTKIYRVFHNQDCFEVSLTMGIANIGNFEPGAVVEVDQNDVWNRLDQILKTFKFTGSNPPPAPAPAPTSGANGTLTGRVTIGPNCPVERIDDPCPPSAQAFAAVEIIVYKPDGKTIAASMNPKPQAASGSSTFAAYSFSLQPGNYLVDYKRTGDFLKAHTKQPVTITSAKTTNLDFDIDTGIR